MFKIIVDFLMYYWPFVTAMVIPGFMIIRGWFKRIRDKVKKQDIIEESLKNLQESVGKMSLEIDKIVAENKPNGGMSMKDIVSDIRKNLELNTIFTKFTLNLNDKLIFYAERDGKYSWVSERWSKYFGIPLDKACGNGWILSISEQDRYDVFKEWIESCNMGNPFSKTINCIDKDGNIVKCKYSSAPLTSKIGSVLGYFGEIIPV